MGRDREFWVRQQDDLQRRGIGFMRIPLLYQQFAGKHQGIQPLPQEALGGGSHALAFGCHFQGRCGHDRGPGSVPEYEQPEKAVTGYFKILGRRQESKPQTQKVFIVIGFLSLYQRTRRHLKGYFKWRSHSM